jgi:hypothetical protein
MLPTGGVILRLDPDAIPLALNEPTGGVRNNSNLKLGGFPLSAADATGGIMPTPTKKTEVPPLTNKSPFDGVTKKL